MRKVLLLPVLVALYGCVQAPLPAVSVRPLDVAADSVEYAPYLEIGTGEIHGQAFLTTRGGDVRLAAGRQVSIDPATTYAREWFRRFGADLRTFDAAPPAPLFQQTRRITTADADGRFRFTGLPAGEYIVRTTVTWETGSGYGSLQGGVVAKLVDLVPGERAEPILNEVYSPDLAATLGLEIIPAATLLDRSYTVISEVEGLDCQVGAIHAAPTEAAARRDLILNAARVNAEALTNVRCELRGISLIPNCTRRIVCTGDAIRLRD